MNQLNMYLNIDYTKIILNIKLNLETFFKKDFITYKKKSLWYRLDKFHESFDEAFGVYNKENSSNLDWKL